jgi:nucleoid DNA-binding protein
MSKEVKAPTKNEIIARGFEKVKESGITKAQYGDCVDANYDTLAEIAGEMGKSLKDAAPGAKVSIPLTSALGNMIVRRAAGRPGREMKSFHGDGTIVIPDTGDHCVVGFKASKKLKEAVRFESPVAAAASKKKGNKIA